jgi:hypothetical protein
MHGYIQNVGDHGRKPDALRPSKRSLGLEPALDRQNVRSGPVTWLSSGRAQDPEDAIEDTAIINPGTLRGLLKSMGD